MKTVGFVTGNSMLRNVPRAVDKLTRSALLEEVLGSRKVREDLVLHNLPIHLAMVSVRLDSTQTFKKGTLRGELATNP
jgi:hypothetical protein